MARLGLHYFGLEQSARASGDRILFGRCLSDRLDGDVLLDGCVFPWRCDHENSVTWEVWDDVWWVSVLREGPLPWELFHNSTGAEGPACAWVLEKQISVNKWILFYGQVVSKDPSQPLKKDFKCLIYQIFVINHRPSMYCSDRLLEVWNWTQAKNVWSKLKETIFKIGLMMLLGIILTQILAFYQVTFRGCNFLPPKSAEAKIPGDILNA